MRWPVGSGSAASLNSSLESPNVVEESSTPIISADPPIDISSEIVAIPAPEATPAPAPAPVETVPPAPAPSQPNDDGQKTITLKVPTKEQISKEWGRVKRRLKKE